MPRRNHRGGTAQVGKPKGGQVRKQAFWHAIAAGIKSVDQQVSR